MSSPTYNSTPCPVIPFAPNWETAPRLVQEYATLVYEKLDLSEERLQQSPRCLYGLSYDVTTFGPRETGTARRFFETLPTTPIGCPFWPDAVTTAAAVSPGASTIPVTDGDDHLFDVLLGYVLVWESWSKYEVVAFAGVSTYEVALSEPLVGSYAAGSKVVPIAWGKVERPEFRQLTGSHAEFSVEFRETFHALPAVPQNIAEGPPLLPAPTLTETPCHEEFTMSISQGGIASIMACTTRYGEYQEIMITDGATDEVTMNNDFTPWDGSWWFRVQYPSGYKTRAVNPTAPNVKPPQIVLGTVEHPLLVSERGYDHLHFSNVAQLSENDPRIQPDMLAVRITERYEYAYVNALEKSITLVNREASGDMTSKTDGTDPKTSESLWYLQSSIANMVGQNEGYGGTYGFSCTIKARTKIGECWSPMTLVAVDVKEPQICSGTMMWQTSGVGSSNEPCAGLTPDSIKLRVIEYLCNNLVAGTWVSTSPFNEFTHSYTITPVPGEPGRCSVAWGGTVIYFTSVTTHGTAPLLPVYWYGFLEIAGGGGTFFAGDNMAALATLYISAYTRECGALPSVARVTQYASFYTACLTT